MNWRGRPLTSHEVIVQTIAATTSRAGLTVSAQLDTGLYPTGVKISDQQMAALPLDRHAWHPDWNYTLRPGPPAPAPDTAATARPARPRAGQDTLSAPALTGLSRPELHALVTALTLPWNAHQEQRRFLRRGGPRRAAPGAGGRARLDLTDNILATLLHLHLSLPRHVIAVVLGTGPDAVSTAIKATRTLLDQHGTSIQPAPRSLRTLSDLYHYAATAGITLPAHIKPAC
jgi:Rhodopirellula transposase DDE domain